MDILKLPLLIAIVLLLASCAAPEVKFTYTDIQGSDVKSIVEEYLKDKNFSVKTTEVRNFKVFGKSKIRKIKKFIGSDLLEWDEITIIAQEYPFSPTQVDLLVQIQVWRQPPIGNKELVKSISNNRRLEGEKALLELDRLIQNSIEGR